MTKAAIKTQISALLLMPALALAQPIWLIVGSDGGQPSKAGLTKLNHYLQQHNCPLTAQWQREYPSEDEWQWLLAPYVPTAKPNSTPVLTVQPIASNAAQVVTRHYSDIKKLADLPGNRIAVVSLDNDVHNQLKREVGVQDIAWRQAYTHEAAVGLLIHQEVDAVLIHADLAQAWFQHNGLRLVVPKIALPKVRVWAKNEKVEWQQSCITALKRLKRSDGKRQLFQVFPRWLKGFG